MHKGIWLMLYGGWMILSVKKLMVTKTMIMMIIIWLMRQNGSRRLLHTGMLRRSMNLGNAIKGD